MGGAQGTGPSPGRTSQPAAAGKEAQAPLTEAEQNTDNYAAGEEGRDFHFSQTACGNKGGVPILLL